MMILAGVSINLLLGDNGIIDRAKEAKFKTEFKAIEEQVNLYKADKETEEVLSGIQKTIIEKLPVGEQITQTQKTQFEEHLKTQIISVSGKSDISTVNLYFIDKSKISTNLKHDYMIDIDTFQIYDIIGEKYSGSWHHMMKENNLIIGEPPKTDVSIPTDYEFTINIGYNPENEYVPTDNIVAYMIKNKEQPDKYDMVCIGKGKMCNFQKIQNYYDDIDGDGQEDDVIWCGAISQYQVVNIDVREGITSVTQGLFGYGFDDYQQQIKSIKLPNSLETLQEFPKTNNITTVELPKNIKSIDGAFYNCTALKNITIPNSVITIGNSTFEGCTSLTDIQIPNSITSIGDNAFKDCTSLTGIEIPNSVITIGNSTFENCTQLTSLELPNGLTSIGEYAFLYSTNISKIVIPETVTTIGRGAFTAWEGYYQTIYVEKYSSKPSGWSNNWAADCTAKIIWSCNTIPGPENWEYSFNAGYDEQNPSNANANIIAYVTKNETQSDAYDIIFVGSGKMIDFTNFYTNIVDTRCMLQFNIPIVKAEIASGITNIPDCLFNYTNISSITIPDTVTTIGNYAFQGCYNLNDIIIPYNVTNMGECVFSEGEGIIHIEGRGTAPEGWSADWNSNFYGELDWNYTR